MRDNLINMYSLVENQSSPATNIYLERSTVDKLNDLANDMTSGKMFLCLIGHIF